MNKILSVLVIASGILLMFNGMTHAKATEHTNIKNEISFKWGVKIPMRDGIKLNGTLYRPKGVKEKLPTIFMLTPYISDSAHRTAIYFAENGYNFISVDTRGRGNSEGEFFPMLPDAKDGYDVVEWLAKQSWSDGKIAMWGGSYRGYAQWAIAKEFPPHLKTIVPTASVFAGRDFPMENNVPYPYSLRWLSLVNGKTDNNNLFSTYSFWTQVYKEYFSEGKSFNSLPDIAGINPKAFHEWSKHTELDSYWAQYSPTKQDYKKLDIPILSITGHYDGDQEGAMLYYKSHMENASAKAASKHYLIMGPWDHGGTRKPKEVVGGIELGKKSKIDILGLHVAWYDWILKGKKKPEFLKDKVAYYTVGTNEWAYAKSLSAIPTSPKKLFLGSRNDAQSVFDSGYMSSVELNDLELTSYKYDPTKLNKFPEGEDNKNYYMDQSYMMSLEGDGVIYHSDKFETDVEIVGQPKLNLWISIDVPDTDFVATLFEINDKGESFYLADTQIRARYRNSLSKASLVTPGDINQYEFNGFKFIGRKIAKGSRLRLVLKSHSYDKQTNYNGGGVVSEETVKDAKVATVKVFHNKKYSSYLEIPVVVKP